MRWLIVAVVKLVRSAAIYLRSLRWVIAPAHILWKIVAVINFTITSRWMVDGHEKRLNSVSIVSNKLSVKNTKTKS
jgi:hypothetical protein